MAKIITVSLYVLRVNVKGNTKNSVKLNKIDGAIDLFETFKGMFAELHGKFVAPEEATRQLLITNAITVDDAARTLDGIVEVGSSGYGSEFFNLKSKKSTYKRKVNDAEMIPLHVRIWIPKGETFGVIALQNFGEVGCKTLLTNLILAEFDKITDKSVLRFREIIPKDAYDELVGDKKITKIRLIHHGVPNDIADKYGGVALDPTLGRLELSISSKRGSELGAEGFVKKMFKRGSFATAGIIELDDFEPHEMKLEVKDENDRKQVISFTDMIKSHSRIDVSNQVALNEEGHSKLESIRAIRVCRHLSQTSAQAR